MITIREFQPSYIKVANEIWNEVVRDGITFPQEEELTEETGTEFFQSQSFTGLALHHSTLPLTTKQITVWNRIHIKANSLQ